MNLTLSLEFLLPSTNGNPEQWLGTMLHAVLLDIACGRPDSYKHAILMPTNQPNGL